MSDDPRSDLLYEVAAWMDDVLDGKREFEAMYDAVGDRLIPVADASNVAARVQLPCPHPDEFCYAAQSRQEHHHMREQDGSVWVYPGEAVKGRRWSAGVVPVPQPQDEPSDETTIYTWSGHRPISRATLALLHELHHDLDMYDRVPTEFIDRAEAIVAKLRPLQGAAE